jgi:phenylacetate-CoA ligase
MDLHQKLIRGVLYPWSLHRAGERATLRYLQEFERTQYLPADELRALQEERLRAVLDHAYRYCPFYRERFDRLGVIPSDLRGLDDLRLLPPLEKSEIQGNRDRMVSTSIPKDEMVANQTGGSTGAPISFFLTRDRKCSRAAGTVRHNRWAGWDVGDKVACVWGAPRDRPPDSVRSRIRELMLERQLYLDTGHFTEASMERFLTRLGKFRPTVMLAYARALVVLAKYIQQRGISPYRPRSIVTSAEVLEEPDRMLLQEVFQCPVFNRYGCREFSVVASECEEHRGLHTMAEGLFIEVEGKDGPTRPGDVGAILVTDLMNFAMPMIRYRIGDMGAFEEGTCPCGRTLPRLRGLAGRVTDFLVGDDGRLVSGVFIATYLLAQRPQLGQVQVVQDTPGKVVYRIKPGPQFQSEPDLAYLVGKTREYLGPTTEVGFDFVAELLPEPSGKTLLCRSTVVPRFNAVPAREEALV